MKTSLFRLLPMLVFGAAFFPSPLAAMPDAMLEKALGSLKGKGTVILDASDPDAFPTRPNNAFSKSETVAVQGQSFTKALRVQVTERVNPPYKVVMHTAATTQAVKKGDWLVVVYAIRCPESRQEDGSSWAQCYLEEPVTYWGLSAFLAGVGREWEVRTAVLQMTKDMDAGKLRFSIHLGKYEQVLEWGPIALVNFGPDIDRKTLPQSKTTYAGREKGAPWRAEAAARIEQVRKGDLSVTVVDAQGRPLTGASVAVRMKRHAYEFGTFLESPLLWGEADGTSKAADGAKYRETVTKLFNRGTSPLYWHDGWGYGNPVRRSNYTDIAAWAQKQGLAIRGHVLVYPGAKFMPKQILALSNDAPAMRKAIAESIAERMELGKKYGFKDFDVVNEMRDNPFPMSFIGWDAVPEWFNQCKSIYPKGLMGINENTILAGYGDTLAQREIYRKQIDAILAAGAKVEVIGFQCHFGSTPTPPVQVYQRIEEFVKYKVPLHATELDISTDDEELQGDYMRDFLTIFFSHPATTAITQWGFWEGQHWIPRAALFRKDWSIKPNGKAYMDLVLGDWWTKADLTTDGKGSIKVRVFKGDYDVTVKVGGKEKKAFVNLDEKGSVKVAMD